MGGETGYGNRKSRSKEMVKKIIIREEQTEEKECEICAWKEGDGREGRRRNVCKVGEKEREDK